MSTCAWFMHGEICVSGIYFPVEGTDSDEPHDHDHDHDHDHHHHEEL
jgi:hypothetical protein